MGLSQWRTMMIDTRMLGSEVSTNIIAHISAIEQRPNGSVRYTFDLLQTERPTLRYAPERVRATTRRPVEGAQIGQGLRGYVRLRPPSGPVRPNGYDFAFNNYFQKIGANGFFLGQPDAITLDDNKWNLRILIERSRLWLARHIRDQDQSRSGAVAAALVTGHKAAIPDEINESLRISGLAHLLSISGLHMALVAGTVMYVLRLAFAVSPTIGSRLPTKKYAALAGFFAIFIYLFLAGASVATQRSFIMLAVMLGALLTDRSALTMRNLALAAIITIMIAPEATLGPSFQMSFAATLALIAAYGAWTNFSAGRKETKTQQTKPVKEAIRKSGSFFLALAITSIIAGTATGMFAAYHFQRVAVFGLLGNLLAMPIASLITMPSAILATLLIPVGLDSYAYAVMNWSIDLVIQISDFVADISPSGAVGALAPSALLYLFVGMITLCILQSKLRYLGLLLVLPALWTQQSVSRPILVVSEDSRQVAVITNDGGLVVNRKRPNSFILEQWKSAYKSNDVLKPGTTNGFNCHEEGYCNYIDRTNNFNKHMLYIDNKDYYDINQSTICSQFDIVILAYSPNSDSCDQVPMAESPSLIVTQQQLALYGSAEIRLNPKNKTEVYADFALGQASRPWQSHRKFSRPARNLAPIVRKTQ
jgi:competence protein ComEC